MTDEKLKKYFLGEIPQSEAEIFEEELSLDVGLTDLAQMIENELVDDYLRNQLSPQSRRLFETNYLITEARRKKLILAGSLWKVANEQTANEVRAAISQPSFWQNWNYRRWALAGFATVLLIGVFIFVWRDSTNNKQEVVKAGNINQSPTPKIDNQNIGANQHTNTVDENLNINGKSNEANSQNNVNIKKTSPTPEVKITPTPKSAEISAPALATFTLLSGTLRDGGEQFIKISPKTNKINLRLSLPKDASKYQTYNATIQNADGETISTFSNLKSLSLNLPADKLENRTYIVFLEGQNSKTPAESIAEYTFRVRR